MVFGPLDLWDGGRHIFHADVDSLPLLDANTDAYLESPNRVDNRVIVANVGKRIYTALGMTLTGRFRYWEFDENYLLVHAARAVFLIAE